MLQGNDQWGNGKILLLPTVIVNKHQYRGRLDVPSILRALCAGFSETTEPEVCCSHAPGPGGLQRCPDAGSHVVLCVYTSSHATWRCCWAVHGSMRPTGQHTV